MSTRSSGMKGEEMACAYLQSLGLRFLQKNYRAGRYEIDLIMRDEASLVFVEVKARSGKGEILGREAVNRQKQRHIITAAQFYMCEHNAFDESIRFDVAEVDLLSGEVVHIPAAFTA